VTPPIGPYDDAPAECLEYDARFPEVAARLSTLISEAAPGTRVEHVGSTAVPGCAGKGVVDLLLLYPPGRLDAAKAALDGLGFQRQTTGNPFPEERPMRTGALVFDGRRYRVHVHVVADTAAEVRALLRFRDQLRSDPELLSAYVAEKRAIIASGVTDTGDYSNAKGGFIRGAIGGRDPGGPAKL
jgi:GrpB-like predicted nucleotidyltransferase (UPF0157 family)